MSTPSTLPDTYVHPSSIIDEGVVLGKGTKVWHFCHVSEGAQIGKGCNLGQNSFIGKNVKMGNNVRLQNNVSVYTGVEVEDDVFLGPSCVFTNVMYPRACEKKPFLPTLLKRGASVGANATILSGTTLGEYCLVGAGAVVTKDVAPYTVVVGNPARPTGNTLGKDGEKESL